jgi:hypothetical protein
MSIDFIPSTRIPLSDLFDGRLENMVFVVPLRTGRDVYLITQVA